MLVITRDINQIVRIGDDIKVSVVSVTGTKVRLGIVAPPHVQVHREEVAEAIEQQMAADRKRKKTP